MKFFLTCLKIKFHIRYQKQRGNYNNQKIKGITTIKKKSKGISTIKKPGGRNETEKMIFFMFHEAWGIEIH